MDANIEVSMVRKPAEQIRLDDDLLGELLDEPLHPDTAITRASPLRSHQS